MIDYSKKRRGNFMQTILPSTKIDAMTSTDRKMYYEQIKNYCENLKKVRANQSNRIERSIKKIYPFLRNYDYDIRGKENIPKNGKCLLVCNHSNSHDYFTVQELFKEIGSDVSVYAASDDLNFLSTFIFSKTKAILADRNSKKSLENSIIDFSNNLMEGIPGAIFGEATWNIHPFKFMHNIKLGAAHLGAITKIPILPTIFEYVETKELCRKEKDLYQKCIINIGKPILIDRSKSLINQTLEIQNTLEKNRLDIWNETNRTFEKDLYLNHTYLKKFGALGFVYDSESEAKYLHFRNGQAVENEYHLDEFMDFVPGITNKEDKVPGITRKRVR